MSMRPRARSPSAGGGACAPRLHAPSATSINTSAPRKLVVEISDDMATDAGRREPARDHEETGDEIGETAGYPHHEPAELLVLERREPEDRRLPGCEIERLRCERQQRPQ